jgi:hypothetical protein
MPGDSLPATLCPDTSNSGNIHARQEGEIGTVYAFSITYVKIEVGWHCGLQGGSLIWHGVKHAVMTTTKPLK